MSRSTVRRGGAGDNAEPRPLALAISALLEGVPDRPVELAPGIYIRSETVVRALAPEILERIEELLGPQSISADAVERIQQYTGASFIPKRCTRCDRLMDGEEAEAGDTCARCSRALSVARSA